jgi:hypothetical protein
MPQSPRLLRPQARGFSPKSISGLALWLDASDATTLFQDAAATTPATATNDPVGAWLDKSGNARHATQSTATSGYRPFFRPASADFNGKNTLLFGPNSGSLLSSATIANIIKNATTAPEITVVCAGYSPNTASGGGWNIGSDVQANGRLFFAIGYGSEGNMIFDTVDASGGRLSNFFGTAMAYRPHTMAFYRHTSAMGVRLDGGVMAAKSNASGNYSATSARLQIGKADTLTYGAIYLSEMLVYAGALSSSDIEKLEAYLSKKWSMSNAYVGGPKVSNVDAQDWIRRVYVSGGTVSSSTAAAVNDFCTAIDAAGIRDRFYRLNLFCGGTSGASDGLAACLVPLYRGQSRLGVQYGNAIDINTGPFAVGDYAETGANGGLTGNGSSKYLDTGFPMNTLPSTTSGHAAVYCPNRSSRVSFAGMIGVNTLAASGFGISTDASVYGIWGQLAFAANTTNGLLMASRTSDSSQVTYVNAVSIATNNTPTTPAASSLNAPVFANRASASVVDNFDNRRYCGYSIGLGLDPTQAVAYYNAMQKFQKAMSREV